MSALAMLAPERTEAATLDVQGSGNGTKVVILGAGVAGMCAAYELGKHGYDCHILEARSRPGGRVWTIRGGTTSTEIGGARQVSTFSEGLYFNPGPARVSHNHVTMDYYRELKVAIQPFINDNFNAYYYNSTMNGGIRVRSRQARFDMLGYTSELLAKAISQDALGAEMTKDDKAALLDYLRESGNLDPNMIYKGSGQAGYSVPPGACDAPGTPLDPLGLIPLIRSRFGMNGVFTSGYDQQPTMFQPVGGMDALPVAFAKQLGDRISYNTEVREIRRLPDGVRVVYRDGNGDKAAEAQYCICTIPLPVLRKIPSDFSTTMKTAIGSIAYSQTVKVGLEFKRRFWEEDDRIYGGISNTNDDITQVWYPNFDFFAPRGVLTAAYAFDKPAVRLGALSPEDRIKAALEQGGKIHKQYPAEYAANGFSVAWHRIPYNEGGWASFTTEHAQEVFPDAMRRRRPVLSCG